MFSISLDQGHPFRGSGHQHRFKSKIQHQLATLHEHVSFVSPLTHRMLQFKCIWFDEGGT